MELLKEQIINKINQIESNHSIKVLYACDAGSRAWGIASENSDYDVRFIYIHKPTYYLSIDPVGIGNKKDTIDIDQTTSGECTIDLHGWELTKALRLFRKSNPTLFEWIHSDIVYHSFTSTIDRIYELEPKIFDTKPCIFHYIHMAKSNYHKCLETKGNVKDYLHVIRPLLISKWVENFHQFPPLNFKALIDNISNGAIKDIITQIFEMKITGTIKRFDDTTLHAFIEQEIIRLESIAKSLQASKKNYTEELDQLFQDALETAWLAK